MFSKQQPILQAVSKQTYFTKASLLTKMNAYTLWTTVMTLQAIPCLVLYNLSVNQAKAFSVRFTTQANSSGCSSIPVAVQEH